MNTRKSQVQGDFPGAAPAAPMPPSPEQMAPAAPAAPAAGMPSFDLGVPAPDFSMGMPGMSMPSAPMSAPAMGDRQEILGPIKSLTQIFYDMDIANFIENNIQFDSDDITRLVWAEYGGGKDGKKDNSKLGKRIDQNTDNSPEEAKNERDSTKNSKWERLEKGKSIEDIVSYSDLGKVVSGLMYGVTMKMIAQGAAPPGGGSAPMMASNKARIIIAKNLDREYLFRESDTIINEIYKKLKLS